MPFRRRREPLHARLAREAGLELEVPRPGPVDTTPTWGETGIHGVPRPRQWDVVVAVAGEGLAGDAVHFVALPDGTLVVDEDVPDGALAPLADAVEASVAPPYRAEAVRRPDGWAVGANRIDVAELPDVGGEVIELAVHDGESTLRVDGEPAFGSAAGLEALARARGHEAYVVHARRLDDDLFEVRVTAL